MGLETLASKEDLTITNTGLKKRNEEKIRLPFESKITHTMQQSGEETFYKIISSKTKSSLHKNAVIDRRTKHEIRRDQKIANREKKIISEAVKKSYRERID